tara:strand:+ start:8568 stop:9392 length:825 start_codon:yes stop_codon:yes gene_type:complete
VNLKAIKKYYNNNGFVILKDFFSKKQLSELEKGLAKNAFKIISKFKINNKPLSDLQFNQKLIDIKKKKPKLFGSFYDSVQHNAKLYQMFSIQKISKILKILNQKGLEEFCLSNIGVRMDAPYDTHHKYNWHQDRAYYPQNRDGNNGMLIWAPISILSKNIGPLRIKPKSHKLGFTLVKKKQKKNHSPQYSLPKHNLSKFKTINLNLMPGDVAFINFHTFHASGDNKSKKIRFAIQARYSDTTDENFLPFNFDVSYNSLIIDELSKKGFSFKDIQ